jgi:chemotaxis response regulator CheB
MIDDKNLKKKTKINWGKVQSTALNFSLMAAGAFISGMAMAAGQQAVAKLSTGMGSTEIPGANVVPLRTQKIG